MNWYNEIKLAQVVEDQKLHYYDIGHTPNLWGQYQDNYLWVWYNGSIQVKPESNESATHSFAFPDVHSWDRVYSGRYEGETGRLSIMKPFVGAAHFRDVPLLIIQKLYQTFPDITDIKVFDEVD